MSNKWMMPVTLQLVLLIVAANAEGFSPNNAKMNILPHTVSQAQNIDMTNKKLYDADIHLFSPRDEEMQEKLDEIHEWVMRQKALEIWLGIASVVSVLGVIYTVCITRRKWCRDEEEERQKYNDGYDRLIWRTDRHDEKLNQKMNQLTESLEAIQKKLEEKQN